jgi:hypothetical protein
MGSFLWFLDTVPLPPGGAVSAAVDLDGGLFGGHVDVLDDDALFTGRAVALQRLELRRIGVDPTALSPVAN